jgi:hypothetical protein
MAMKLTANDLQRAATRAESMRNRLTNLKKRTEKVAERAVHTVEVGTSAFAFGLLQGKTGGLEFVGVPAELIAGAGLHIAGFLGLGGKMSSHLHGFGDGALASYLTTMGRGVGLQWAAKAATTPTPGKDKGTGILENRDSLRSIGRGAASLHDAEIAQAVAAAVED